MHAALAATLFGLMAALSWGISDLLIGKSSRCIGPIKGALIMNAYCAIAYSIAYALFLHGSAGFTVNGTIYAIIGGILSGLAQISLFKAMRSGSIGLVSSISSTYPLITLLIGIIVFAVRPSYIQILGILLIVAGVMAASGILSPKAISKRLGRSSWLALMSALGWGTGWILVSQSMASMGWQSVLLIELIVTSFTLLILVPFVKGNEHLRAKELLKGCLSPAISGAAVAQILGMMCVYLEIDRAPDYATIVIVVSSCYPALAAFLALRNMNERIPVIPLVGGAVSVVGVVILTLG